MRYVTVLASIIVIAAFLFAPFSHDANATDDGHLTATCQAACAWSFKMNIIDRCQFTDPGQGLSECMAIARDCHDICVDHCLVEFRDPPNCANY